MIHKVIGFISKLVESVEPEFALKLDRIIYSNEHHCEVCVIQLVGKNAWPVMTTTEILSDPDFAKELSDRDLVMITRLDKEIQRRTQTYKVLEIDQNGTILLEDQKGHIKRYAEKNVSADSKILNGLSSIDAHDIGYRVGFRNATSLWAQSKKH